MKRSMVMLTGAGLVIAALAATGGYLYSVGGGAGRPVITETPEAAQKRAERCAVIKASVADAGFADKVSVGCDKWQAHLSSNSYPDHVLMNGIVGSNEQVPVPAINHSAPVALEPRLTKTAKTRDSSLGVAVNGVPIFDYTGGGEMSAKDLHHHQTQHDTILTRQLDKCGGHAGRGDDYHYHATPTCMIDAMKNKGDAAIIGWAFDGFPIYGKNNPDGTAIAPKALDVCNGQADKVFGYRYHTSDTAPYIIQCLMGEVPSMRDLPRIAPLRPADGSVSKTTGRPPRGGVEGLTFSQDATGARRMEYSYEGKAYYIRYKPSDKPGCYRFETRTVTDNGVVKKGEYCR
ncbi:MAG: YHYH protein [Hyphomicrobiaceae bacterium]